MTPEPRIPYNLKLATAALVVSCLAFLAILALIALDSQR